MIYFDYLSRLINKTITKISYRQELITKVTTINSKYKTVTKDMYQNKQIAMNNPYLLYTFKQMSKLNNVVLRVE